MGHPRGDLALPQQHAVEGVARHEPPLRGPVHQRRVPLVEDVEETPCARGHGAHARQGVVVAGPLRSRHPLDPARRADPLVLRHGIARGVVQEVRPFVDVSRPGLHRLLPAYHRHAARSEDAHHFGHRHVAQRLRHEEIHQVVHVRQALAVERLDGYLAVEALRQDMPARGGDALRRGVEPLHEVALVGAQGGREPSVAAGEMHDEAALDACLLEDLLRVRGVCRATPEQETRQSCAYLPSRHVGTPRLRSRISRSPCRPRCRSAARCRVVPSPRPYRPRQGAHRAARCPGSRRPCRTPPAARHRPLARSR